MYRDKNFIGVEMEGGAKIISAMGIVICEIAREAL